MIDILAGMDGSDLPNQKVDPTRPIGVTIIATATRPDWEVDSDVLARLLEPFGLMCCVQRLYPQPPTSVIDELEQQFRAAIASGDHQAATAWHAILKAY